MKNGVTTSHTGLFAIRGNSPEFQYNSIAIQQQKGQFEYRFKPYPGNYFTRGNNFGKQVNVLMPSTDDQHRTLQHYSSIISGVGSFNVLFSGNEAQTINEDDVYISNTEWNIEASTRIKDGLVSAVSLPNTSATEWKSDSNFDGRASTLDWVSQGIINNDGWRIKYNDPSTNIYVPDGYYVWNLYPSGADARRTPGGDPGPGVGNWQKVFFISGNTKYKPAQNAQGGHPDNKDYLFFVEQYNRQLVAPTPFFSGVVDIIHDGYVGRGQAGTLKVNLTVYKDGDKYHALWSIDPNNRGVGYDQAHSIEGLYIPNTVSGVGQILPSRIQIVLTVGSVELDVPGKDLNRFDVIKDWNIYEGDVNSNKNEPEHQICYVNEIVNAEPNGEAKYTDLAYAGLVINSSKEWTNFSQFSAYF